MLLLTKDSLDHLGKDADAISHFDKVLKIDPNNLLALKLKNNAEQKPSKVQ